MSVLFLRCKYSFNHVFSFLPLHNLCLISIKTKTLCGILYLTFPAMGCWCSVQSPALWDPCQLPRLLRYLEAASSVLNRRRSHAWCCHITPPPPTPNGFTPAGVFGIVGQQCIAYFLHRIFVVRNTQWNVLQLPWPPNRRCLKCSKRPGISTVSCNHRFLHELLLWMLSGRIT
jgi:hypothetical protein